MLPHQLSPGAIKFQVLAAPCNIACTRDLESTWKAQPNSTVLDTNRAKTVRACHQNLLPMRPLCASHGRGDVSVFPRLGHSQLVQEPATVSCSPPSSLPSILPLSTGEAWWRRQCKKFCKWWQKRRLRESEVAELPFLGMKPNQPHQIPTRVITSRVRTA